MYRAASSWWDVFGKNLVSLEPTGLHYPKAASPPGWGYPCPLPTTVHLACGWLCDIKLLSRANLMVDTGVHIILYPHLMPPSLPCLLLKHIHISIHDEATCPLLSFWVHWSYCRETLSQLTAGILNPTDILLPIAVVLPFCQYKRFACPVPLSASFTAIRLKAPS